MPLKMKLRPNESIEQAVKRFKKLLERSGIPKEVRRHEYYEKPSEQRRRQRLRKLKAIRKRQAQLAEG
ncbi:30S ribosomal protein S21 [bacterium HR36]|nr:30S ribosomal protein S21 [bacterium HR36]